MTYKEPKSTTTEPGLITLAGDLGGTATSPSVLKINGTSVPATPTSGQVLTATSGTSATWQTPTTGTITALTGDVTASGSGSVAATVVSLTGSAGTVTVNGTSTALSWAAGSITLQTNGTSQFTASSTTTTLGIGGSNTSTVFQVGGTTNLTLTSASLAWASGITTPSIKQTQAASGAGTSLTVQSQQGATTGNQTGGNLVLSSGSGGGTGTAGNTNIQTGATNQITITPATITTGVGSANTSTVLQVAGTTNLTLTSATFQWAQGITTPAINQAAAASSAGAGTAGTAMSHTAQTGGATTGSVTTAGAGGALTISSGAGGSGSGGTNANGGAGGSLNLTGGAGGAKSGTGITGFDGYVLFQPGGVTQAFASSALSPGIMATGGLGIGSTPGTSPTLSSGSGAPSNTANLQPNGSIFLRTNGTSTTGLYTMQSAAWSAVGGGGSGGTLTAPITATPITTNSTHATYTIDTTGGGSDAIILHSDTGAVTYVLPAPTTGREIEFQDISGTVGTAANNVFFAPHAAEKINTSSGFTLTGTFTVSNGSTGVTATSSQTGILVPGMSIVFGADTASYIISVVSGTSITLASTYGGILTSGNTAKMNSLTFAANFGRLFIRSNGTDWFIKGDGTPTVITYTANGTHIPPAGVTIETLQGYGGGGSGAGGNQSSVTEAGGGGGGGSIQSTILVSVVPGQAYSVTIGAGGASVAAGVNAGKFGTDTTFGSLATFGGASGGGGGSSTSFSPGGAAAKSGTGVNLSSYDTSPTTSLLAVGHPGSGGISITTTGGTAGSMNPVGGFAGGAAGAVVTNAGGGGGGAGPGGAGGAGGAGSTTAAGAGSPAAANTGAGGGGGGDGPLGGGGGSGAGGSGQLIVQYVL